MGRAIGQMAKQQRFETRALPDDRDSLFLGQIARASGSRTA